MLGGHSPWVHVKCFIKKEFYLTYLLKISCLVYRRWLVLGSPMFKSSLPPPQPGPLHPALVWPGRQVYEVRLPFNSEHSAYVFWNFLQGLDLNKNSLVWPYKTQKVSEASKQTLKCLLACSTVSGPWLCSIHRPWGDRHSARSSHVTESFQDLTRKKGKSIFIFIVFPLVFFSSQWSWVVPIAVLFLSFISPLMTSLWHLYSKLNGPQFAHCSCHF